jgi:arabinofuranosyltransferase
VGKEEPYDRWHNRRNVNWAVALNAITTPGATIGVFSAGSLPYYTDRYAVDFLGQSDRYIAHLTPDLSGALSGNRMTSVPGHNKYDLRYSIMELEPTYVMAFKWGRDDLGGLASR